MECIAGRMAAFVALLLALALTSVTAGFAEKTPQSISPSVLLVKSYLLSRSLVPEERASLLLRLSEASGRWQPDMTLLWTQELFQLAQELPPTWNRVAFQQGAVVNLSKVDADSALVLLEAMDDPLPNRAGMFVDDVRAFAAQMLFPQYWKLHGRSSVAVLRRTANRIADGGEYPYLAVVPIIKDLSPTNPVASSEVVSDAIRYYQRGSKFRSENRYFANFIQQLFSTLPPALKRAAIEAAIAKLTETPREQTTSVYHARVVTDKGAAELTDEREAILFELLPLIRQTDPRLADHLLQQSPSLRGHESSAGTVEHKEAIRFSSNPKDEARIRHELEESRFEDVLLLANENRDGAVKLAATISDPAIRAAAWAAIASAAASEDKDEAKRLLSRSLQSPTKDMQALPRLRALSAICRAQSLVGDTRAADTWREAFDLGVELFQQDLDLYPGKLGYTVNGFQDLVSLVETGIRLDVATVLAVIDNTQNHVLRAHLLVNAAKALNETKRSQ